MTFGRPEELALLLGDPDDESRPFARRHIAELDRARTVPRPGCAPSSTGSGLPAWYVPAALGGRLARLDQLAQTVRVVAGRDLTVAIAHAQDLPRQRLRVAGRGRPAARGARGRSPRRRRRSPGDSPNAATAATCSPAKLTATPVATPIGDGYRLDGTKWLINNATRADLVSVLARTGDDGGPRGFTVLLVDKRALPTGSYAHLPKELTHGIRGADISGITFAAAPVPASAVVGPVGGGVELVLLALQVTRTACVALSLGAADHALRLAHCYAAERELYGRPLVELASARRSLGRGYAALFVAEAVSLFAGRTAHLLPGELSVVSAVVKSFVPTLVDELVAGCGELLGARAFLTGEYAHGMFQKVERDHRIVGIFDGSTFVNRAALVNQFPLLARAYRRPADVDADATQATLGDLAADLPPLRWDGLELLSRTGCSLLNEASTAVDGLRARPRRRRRTVRHPGRADRRDRRGAPGPGRIPQPSRPGTRAGVPARRPLRDLFRGRRRATGLAAHRPGDGRSSTVEQCGVAPRRTAPAARPPPTRSSRHRDGLRVAARRGHRRHGLRPAAHHRARRRLRHQFCGPDPSGGSPMTIATTLSAGTEPAGTQPAGTQPAGTRQPAAPAAVPVGAVPAGGVAIVEAGFGDPWQPDNPLGFAGVLAADERAEMFGAGEEYLDGYRLGAEFVPAALGGRFTRLDGLIDVMRALFRRDPCLGLGYGAASFIASVNVWAAGSPAQQQRLAQLLLDNQKVSSVYHELAHGNDMSHVETAALPDRAGTLRLNGHKEVVTNCARSTAMVIFARTDERAGGRSHSQLFVEKRDLAEDAFGYLPRFPSAGMRGVQLGGVWFDNCAVPDGAILGAPGDALSVALRSFQLTRTALPAMAVGILDTGLRCALRFAADRRLYGGRVLDQPVTRAILAECFIDLLICDSLATTVARTLHLAPDSASGYASASKYLVSGLAMHAMYRLSQLLGAQFYRRTGGYAIFQKLLRDLAPAGFGHAARVACLATMLPQLPRLARGDWRAPDQILPVAAFQPGTDLPALDFAALTVTTRHDPLLATLTTETTPDPDPALRGLLTDATTRAGELRAQCAALPVTALAVGADADALTLPARYAALLAATACREIGRAATDGFLADLAWPVAALTRLAGPVGPAAAPLPAALAAEAFRELLARFDSGRTFDLLGHPIGR